MPDTPVLLPHHHSDGAQAFCAQLDCEALSGVSELLKFVSDPSRLRIFWFLCHCEECVLDIAAATGMSSPAVSHHLRLLKNGGLLVSNRNGKEMIYKAADTPEVAALKRAVEAILAARTGSACPCQAEGHPPCSRHV